MRGKRLLLPLCTLLMLALGCVLPRLSAIAQDQRLVREVIEREEPQIALTLENPGVLLETMALMEQPHTELRLSEGGRMTKVEAQDSAAALREKLAGLGLVGSTPAGPPESEVLLIASREEKVHTAILWRCFWREDGDSFILWLDDESGKLVAFQGVLNGGASAVAMKGRADTLSLVAEFCRSYYGDYEVGKPVDPFLALSGGEELYFIPISDDEVLYQSTVFFSEASMGFNCSPYQYSTVESLK